MLKGFSVLLFIESLTLVQHRHDSLQNCELTVSQSAICTLQFLVFTAHHRPRTCYFMVMKWDRVNHAGTSSVTQMKPDSSVMKRRSGPTLSSWMFVKVIAKVSSRNDSNISFPDEMFNKNIPCSILYLTVAGRLWDSPLTTRTDKWIVHLLLWWNWCNCVKRISDSLCTQRLSQVSECLNSSAKRWLYRSVHTSTI